MQKSAYDFRADRNGAELARLAGCYEFPQFVKAADFDALHDPGPLPDRVYADVVRRQLNCDTPASTWLSALYFFDKQAAFQPNERQAIAQRLQVFGDYWRITPELNALAARAAALAKAAAAPPPDEVFAYIAPNGTRHAPLRTPLEVKAATDWLYANRDTLPFGVRNQIAEKILEKAAACGAGLGTERDEFLEKQAGRGFCLPDAVVTLVRNRARLAAREDLREGMNKTASLIEAEQRRFCQPDNLVKLAEVIDQFDRTIGLVGKHTAALPRPEDVLFALTHSKAATDLADRCALTSGSVYTREALSKVALDDVRSLFGEDFATGVRAGLDVDPEKLAAAAATLPLPDAELFDALMESAGVHPVLAKSASEQRLGLSDAELDQLAALYGA